MSIFLSAAVALSFAAQTDTIVPVQGATTLSVEAPGGSIVVSTWDRNDVRIQADHSSRTYVSIDRHGDRLDVEAEARMGPATIIDYVITVPASMDLDLEGMWTRIEVRGSQGEVAAETNQGDILIVGGRGLVSASSTNGEIRIQDSEASVHVEAVAGTVRIINVGGDIEAESVGGDIVFDGVRSRKVEAGTVGGRILYDGTVEAGGSYLFGTHGGPLAMRIPEGAGAEVSVATIHGGVRAMVPGAPARFPRGQRTRFQVGNGGATVELETFSGSILITRDPLSMDGRGNDTLDREAGHLQLFDRQLRLKH